jgi:two-component system CheB/CheR fusion protein
MSSNEELSTVNEELQNRNNEMHDLNTDLGNLLATIQVPVLILDTDMRIRRMTPPAERLLNLIPTDVGRKMTDIRPRLDLPDITRHVAHVVDTLEVKDVEVHDDEGRWYSMRIRPAKTRAQRIDGVVITWTEIDPSRAIEARGAHGYGDALLERMSQPAAILTADMRIGASNAAWREAFPVTLDPGRWRPDPDALDGGGSGPRRVRLPLTPGGSAVDLEAKPLEGRTGTTEGAILLTVPAS